MNNLCGSRTQQTDITEARPREGAKQDTTHVDGALVVWLKWRVNFDAFDLAAAATAALAAVKKQSCEIL